MSEARNEAEQAKAPENGDQMKVKINCQFVFESFLGILEDLEQCMFNTEQSLKHSIPVFKFCELVGDPVILKFTKTSVFYCLTEPENRAKLVKIFKRISDITVSIEQSLTSYHEFIIQFLGDGEFDELEVDDLELETDDEDEESEEIAGGAA